MVKPDIVREVNKKQEAVALFKAEDGNMKATKKFKYISEYQS